MGSPPGGPSFFQLVNPIYRPVIRSMSNNDPKAMSRLMTYLGNYRTHFLLSSLASILNKVLDLMPPILVAWVVDSLQGNAPYWMAWVTDTQDPWSLAILLALLTVIIFGFESLFEWLFEYGFMTLAQKVQHDLRLDAYRKIQAREMAWFENNRVGDALSILNDDVNQLERFMNSGFNEILQLLVLFVFAGAVLFGISWQLALVGMMPLPLILLGSIVYQRWIANRYRAMRETVGALSSRLENNISGIAVIKSFTAEEFEASRVSTSSQDYRKANFHAIKISTLYVPLIRMLIAVGFGGVLLLGSYWVIEGKNGLTIGELVLFSMMIQRVLWPVTRLGQVLDTYARAKASAERVFHLMDTPSTIQNKPNPVRLGRAQGEIAFRNVQFKYRDGLPILNGLDFVVKPGETLGIAGTSGAGKSTLVKLLLRFYDPTGGQVELDGHPVSDLDLQDLRRNIALVSQDVYLFHGTIRENIAYGMGELPLQEVEKAAKIAQLDHFIQSLPEKYETLIGERGLKLSGGQRQRLSIARAVLKNAPVIIMDEATSSVDTETERAIQRHIDAFTSGRTALLIAHRLSTLRQADRIIVLDKGQVAEVGTHDELIAQSGIYADLWNVQTGELMNNG